MNEGFLSKRNLLLARRFLDEFRWCFSLFTLALVVVLPFALVADGVFGCFHLGLPLLVPGILFLPTSVTDDLELPL